jgi:hypothetical protein
MLSHHVSDVDCYNLGQSKTNNMSYRVFTLTQITRIIHHLSIYPFIHLYIYRLMH